MIKAVRDSVYKHWRRMLPIRRLLSSGKQFSSSGLHRPKLSLYGE